MNPIEKFNQEKKENIDKMNENTDSMKSALNFIVETAPYKYTYNFTWMGRPIIQFPQDMIAMQEIIWNVKPDLIIETGIAHGGSIIYYASLLELIGKGEVVGVDIEIKPHNKSEIEKHPMFKRITLIEGSSISMETVNKVKAHVEGKKTVMVVLDSNHTHDHVLNELNLYSSFVTEGSYMVVFDTLVEDLPEHLQAKDRPWGKSDNPKTAVWEFLKANKSFVIDKEVENKILITVAPDGFLKRIE